MTHPINHNLSNLVAEIQARYEVGPYYAEAYLNYWCRARGRNFTNLASILNAPEPDPMWFEYALSTNQRGRQLAELLQPYLLPNSQRYLDVGCGFGGSLVAFIQQDMEVLGIEIDAQRMELAQANCADYGLSNCVLNASILETDLRRRLGTFDLITCIDVIEHVNNVPGALRNMVALLNPRGVLVLEIPNRHDLRFVAHDGHFNLFGITLLDRQNAIGYHRRFFTFEYDVGDYYDSSYYQSQLRFLGCETHFIESPFHVPVRLNHLSSLFLRTLGAYLRFWVSKQRELPLILNIRLQWQFAKYVTGLAFDVMTLVFMRRQIPIFKQRYLTDFWTLVANKK